MFSYKRFFGKRSKRKITESLKKHLAGVPQWPRRYITACSQIKDASREQQVFYECFKKNFLGSVYLDLAGNANYAFILLFDLLEDYQHHQDVAKLSKQLKSLRRFYPKTRSKCNSILHNGTGNVLRKKSGLLLKGNRHRNLRSSTGCIDGLGLGVKYKLTLNLSDAEVKLLNRVGFRPNSFSRIEGYLTELIKLYLIVIAGLEANYRKSGTSLEQQFRYLAKVPTLASFKQIYRDRKDRSQFETIMSRLYSGIFRECENKLREIYGYRQMRNINMFSSDDEALQEAESSLRKKLSGLIEEAITSKVSQKKRIKISLDTRSIEAVQKSHAATVELLKNYLHDTAEQIDHKDDGPKSIEGNINIDRIQGAEICPKMATREILKDPIYKTVLEMFSKKGLSVYRDEWVEFARAEGYFANFLIDRINEICYATLNDFLIEESKNEYKISSDNFQKISSL